MLADPSFLFKVGTEVRLSFCTFVYGLVYVVQIFNHYLISALATSNLRTDVMIDKLFFFPDCDYLMEDNSFLLQQTITSDGLC